MRSLCTALIALGIVLARVSTARELEFDLRGEVGYSSNVFRAAEDEVSDLTYRFIPTMKLRDTDLPLTYEVTYSPSFFGYLEHTDASVWNQYVVGSLTRALGSRTQFSISDSFLYSANRLYEDQGGTEPDEPFLGHLRNARNNASVVGQHAFTERMTGQTTLGYDVHRYESRRRSDSDGVWLSFMLTRGMSDRDALGLGSRIGYRSYDDSDEALDLDLRNASEDQTYHVFVYVKHDFSDGLEVTLRAGPTWIRDKRWVSFFAPGPDGNPVLDHQEKVPGSRLTWFGTFDIKKKWKRVAASAGYSRQESMVSANNRSALVDSITARLSWNPSASAMLLLRASWSRRQTGDVGLGTGVSNVWNGSLIIRRRLTQKSGIRASFGYHSQDGNLASRVQRMDEYWGRFGFDYAFSAIRF
jgi:hypothetical protein